MHRHGYKGRKFGRERDQRRALIKGLASNLALNEKITTTVPKAKELRPYFEKLITKAKAGGLHNRRQVIAKMANIESAHKLVDEIGPKLNSTTRSSGHLRIVKSGTRRGDNAELATISFVDDLSVLNSTSTAKPEIQSAKAVDKKSVTKKPTDKTVKKEAK